MISVYVGDQPEWTRDHKVHFLKIQEWATETFKIFVPMSVFDVSDTSGYYDYLAKFDLQDEQQATLFRLKWNTV